VSLDIQGPIQIGRKGEPRALDTLLCKLREEEQQPILKSGRDQFGEDGILQLQDKCFTLQVVSLPSCSDLWRDANRDSARKSVSVEVAAKWIWDAVFAKSNNTSPVERPKTILVLDAGLAGIISTNEVTNAYLSLYGDPIKFGFKSIWLVGPTTNTTILLGTECL